MNDAVRQIDQKLLLCVVHVIFMLWVTWRKIFDEFSPGGQMDEVDEAIVSLLEVDGRLSHSAIAHRLGLSRSVAATQVQRLLDSGQGGRARRGTSGRAGAWRTGAHQPDAVDGPAPGSRSFWPVGSMWRFCR